MGGGSLPRGVGAAFVSDPHNPQAVAQSWTSSLPQVYLLGEVIVIGPARAWGHQSWEGLTWCEHSSWGPPVRKFPPHWGTRTASATTSLLKIKCYSPLVRIVNLHWKSSLIKH